MLDVQYSKLRYTSGVGDILCKSQTGFLLKLRSLSMTKRIQTTFRLTVDHSDIGVVLQKAHLSYITLARGNSGKLESDTGFQDFSLLFSDRVSGSLSSSSVEWDCLLSPSSNAVFCCSKFDP
jgi:hypothetical protein